MNKSPQSDHQYANFLHLYIKSNLYEIRIQEPAKTGHEAIPCGRWVHRK
jgi:hypothetical protein